MVESKKTQLKEGTFGQSAPPASTARALPAVAMMLVAMVLGACASSDPAAAPTPTASTPETTTTSDPATSTPVAGEVDACTLLTEQEIREATQLSGGDSTPTSETNEEGGICRFGPDGQVATVVVSLDFTAESFESFKKHRTDQAKQLGNDPPESVAGVGDDAFIDAGIHVLEGQTYLQITLAFGGKSELVRLAKLALSRL